MFPLRTQVKKIQGIKQITWKETRIQNREFELKANIKFYILTKPICWGKNT